MIRFLLDGDIVELENCDPTMTVLEWLRIERQRTGTKEGCAEGDCGACTVVVGELQNDVVRYRSINACIMFMPMLQGKELVTVESLGTSDDLHPVQKTLAEAHGSQCGFCTPGFVMSMFARYQDSDTERTPQIDDALAGNLCRCTGYGPIKAAAENCTPSSEVQNRFGNETTRQKLESLASGEHLGWRYQDAVLGETRLAFKPQTKKELLQVLADHPSATLVSGATDVGLWVTKQRRNLDCVIFLDGIGELKKIQSSAEGLKVGAGVKYSDAWKKLGELHADFGELVRRIGSVQVRNSGTIGGNIANGSPIGDTMPALIAMSAELVLESLGGNRQIPLEAFFIAYGKQDLRLGEIVSEIIVPTPKPTSYFATYKISKRFDQDISAVCGAFSIELDDGEISNARIVFGGMAGTPKRASHVEAALNAKSFTEATIRAGMDALEQDYAPLSDMRASESYRMKVAQNLLLKFYMEKASTMRTRICEDL